MAEEKHNLKNPSVKRILQEVKEMQNNTSDDYMSLPLEDNIFEWQFAIRGPQDTEFEGGIYHGRIQLPPEYPFKPPAFMLLTPNGRFETQTKICLSISQHHPEHWQPSWSVRTALVALIAFMPTKPDGAIGSLDYTKEERRALAVKSCAAPPKYGNAERQHVIDEIHEHMLKKSPPVPDASLKSASSVKNETTKENSIVEDDAIPPDVSERSEDTSRVEGEGGSEIVDSVQDLHANASPVPEADNFNIDYNLSANIPGDQEPPIAVPLLKDASQSVEQVERIPRPVARNQPADDRFLTVLVVALTVALVAVVVKRFMKSFWWFDAGSI